MVAALKPCLVGVIAIAMAGSRAPTGPAPTGTIRGLVSFRGAPPSPPSADMASDPWCAAHAPAPRSVVNDDGSVPGVLVYVVDAPAGASPTTPAAPVLDQSGCQYHPPVLAVSVGQEFVVRNSDETLHNVHVTAVRNRGFNIGQPLRGLESRRRFDTAEAEIDVKCDIHGWMSGAIFVFDHPHFTTAGADGSFELPDLPAGTWTVRAWHPRLGARDYTVTVPATGVAELSVLYRS